MSTHEERRAWFGCDFMQQHLNAALTFGRDEWVRGIVPMIRGYSLVGRFESPLEMAFCAWWAVLASLHHISDMDYRLQSEVAVEGKAFRVDMELLDADESFALEGAKLGLPVPRIAVELDGHEFHERTKEQVAYRDARDRALQAAGWKVFHVSGSVFHRDPHECVWNIYLDATKVFWDFRHLIWRMQPQPKLSPKVIALLKEQQQKRESE